MSQNSLDSFERNTNNTCSNERFRSFFFTWNNYPENYSELLKSNLEKFEFQKEIGETGNEHIQGIGMFKNQRTFSQVKKLFPGMHIERVKNWAAALNYVNKSETAVLNTHEGNVRKILKDPLEPYLNCLYPFQNKILNILKEEPDNRIIYWFYDTKGCIGKTSLAKHLCIKYPNETLFLGGKSSDIKYGVFSFTKKNTLRNCIFHFTRTVENFISYEALESIKDGIFYNTKYESEMCLFDPPHIICLANFKPETDKMSLDRWRIFEILDDGEYIRHDC